MCVNAGYYQFPTPTCLVRLALHVRNGESVTFPLSTTHNPLSTWRWCEPLPLRANEMLGEEAATDALNFRVLIRPSKRESRGSI